MWQVFACIGLTLVCMSSVVARDVAITSVPSGAEVIVDGRVLGTTPLVANKKMIMPNWMTDGAITQATVTIRMPMYESYSVTFSEFRVPREISAVLERDESAFHFENYIDAIEGLSERTQPSMRPAALYVSDDLDSDSFMLELNGHLLVGYVGATAAIVPLETIREKSDELNGAVILVKSSDAGAQTEMRAVTSTISGGLSTTFSSRSVRAQASAFGHGSSDYGSLSAFGSSNSSDTAVTFIPSRAATSWVPYSTRQYSTQATIWRKRKVNGVGLALDVIPPSIRAELQRNTGAFVAAVEEGSSAFLSDVLVGDVVVEAAQQVVRQPSDLDLMIDEAMASARSMPIVVLRHGERVELELLLR